MTALHQLHCVWRHGPRPWSLLLDQAMESAGAADTQVPGGILLELLTINRQSCSITEKAPTNRSFFWLKAATTAFTFKILLRHYAKLVLTPW